MDTEMDTHRGKMNLETHGEEMALAQEQCSYKPRTASKPPRCEGQG